MYQCAHERVHIKEENFETCYIVLFKMKVLMDLIAYNHKAFFDLCIQNKNLQNDIGESYLKNESFGDWRESLVG